MRNHPRTVPIKTMPTWLMSNGPLRDHRDAAPPRIKYAPQFSREITSSESRVPSSCALRCDALRWTVRKQVVDTRLSLEIVRPNLWEGMVNSGRLHGPCERRGYRRLTGRDRMVMEPVSVESAIEKAKKKGLRPGRVKGTAGIRFAKGRSKRIEVITWGEFRKTLKERKLQVYESGGTMKIMK